MANRIRELREARGLTQEQIAEAADTTFQQISRLEKGKRRLTDDWMRRLAPVLGVAPGALLVDKPPDIVRLVQQPKKFRLAADEIALLGFWRRLDLSEKRMIITWARDKGIEILADDPQDRTTSDGARRR